jgi:Arc/MetJ-type ribon-helix-helix transcriptional regulator
VPTIDLSIRDDLESEITQLVEQGEFLNRERAVEELLQRGIAAYDVGDDEEEDPFAEEGGAGDYTYGSEDPI